ncbi:MAG: deoxycytidylate deaminase [Denitrovibrio sp.]|nr:MAG: deoxycytidylate deaminase [Denitrovibrio sp.]
MGDAAEKKNQKTVRKSDSAYDVVINRRTQELVIGFCGALGSGVSSAISVLETIFSGINYNVKIIKMSDLILRSTHLENNFADESDRITKLQDCGNKLRQHTSKDILAQLAIEELKAIRMSEHKLEPKDPLPVEERVLWIIDSIKHPAEVELFRAVYGSMFYLVGVLCPEETRIHRLVKSKEINQASAVALIERDKSEDLAYGQKLLKALQHADFFINYSDYNRPNLSSIFERFIRLLFGVNISPTKGEFAMHVAWSSSLRSACLSRQVGAAIINDAGEIIATGCNDVPSPNGGLYNSQDRCGDHRCYNTHEKCCSSDKYKKTLYTDIKKVLDDHNLGSEDSDQILSEIKRNTRIKDLIEFSRAVHAEMDAIVAASRKVSCSTKNAIMYVTTFPCHNCAKHIVASGIRSVYYIEPYEKSLAFDLHDDSISIGESEGKIAFLPFEGVAPKLYAKVFMQRGDRKIDGIVNEVNLSEVPPVSDKFVDGYAYYEVRVIDKLNKFKKDDKIVYKEDE